MKNTVAINRAKVFLVENGVLEPSEEIYTKNVWRNMGYKVNAGETPVASISIYVYAPRSVYDEDSKTVVVKKMVGVRANFYKVSQVTKIIKKGA